MKKKQTIIAAVVLMLVLLVGGLIAYFTDKDEKTNTFTIGNVDIELLELSWKATDAENKMPGEKIDKDPKVHNKSTTNDAYVFLKVVSPCTTANASDGDVKEILLYRTTAGAVNSGWTELESGTCTNGSVTRVYYYGTDGTLTKLAADATTGTLFDEVTVNSAIDGDEDGIKGNLDVVVTAYGIQTDGLTDDASTAPTPAEAWAKFTN